MTAQELIKKLQEYHPDTQVKVFDWRKCLHNDTGDGSGFGVYDFDLDMQVLEDDEKDYYKKEHGLEHEPFIQIVFDNDDYTEEGEHVI